MKKNRGNPFNGWLILDKPSGITSAHAVAKVKRLLRPQKIGHAGTLDPLASGILPLALGEATKTVPYMMDASKAYSFTVSWGEERDTDDCMGQVTQSSVNRPQRKAVEAVLPGFKGAIQQTPPDYSAIKVEGKRAYDMARNGEALELKSRQVIVHSLEITDFTEQKAHFICHCGKGTYIRSFARDMGRMLGCFGHISALRRVKVGAFDELHAISLEVLEEMVHKDGLQTAQGVARSEEVWGDFPQSYLKFLRPVEAALDDIPAWNASSDQAMLLRSGQNVFLPDNAGMVDGKIAIHSENNLVAIGELSQGSVKPVRVFNL